MSLKTLKSCDIIVGAIVHISTVQPLCVYQWDLVNHILFLVVTRYLLFSIYMHV